MFQIYNNIGKDDAAQAQTFIDTWTWNELSVAGFQEIITNYEGRYTRQTIELLKGLKAVLGDSGLLAYLISMTQRVNEIQRVLKPTGSFYLHCDPTASHYLKLIMDSLFCARGGDFVNEITWKRTSSHNRAKKWGPVHDAVLFYSKSNSFVWNRVVQHLDGNYVDSFYRFKDEKGRYCLDNLTGPGIVTAGSSGKPWKGIDPTVKGRHWEPPPDRTLPPWFVFPNNYAQMPVQERLDTLEAQGFIYATKNKDAIPRFKRYLLESSGAAIQDVITDIQSIGAQAAERIGYPTQKPEALLERIIQASSNEGDTVLDAYCGCGTTVAVAQRLRRNWIGIDITYQSIAVILKRLEDSFGADIMNTVTLDGIPRDMESDYALANKKDDRVRKEFEKWALLTYSKNRATINEKKGADKGIDSIAYIITSSDTTARVIFQVKSGKVKRNDIATLNSDRQREDAVMAILITLEESTKPMRDEALAVGTYHHELLNRDYPIIQIVTIQEMIEENKRIDLPLNIAVLKAAKAVIKDEQKGLL